MSKRQRKIKSLFHDLRKNKDKKRMAGKPVCTLCSKPTDRLKSNPICRSCKSRFKLRISANPMFVTYATTGTAEEVSHRYEAVCKYHYNILMKLSRMLSSLPEAVYRSTLAKAKQSYLFRIQQARYFYQRRGPKIDAMMNAVLYRWAGKLVSDDD